MKDLSNEDIEALKKHFKTDSLTGIEIAIGKEKALTKEREANPIIIDSICLDIGNGGMFIRVEDRGRGPSLTLQSNQLGNIIADTVIHTDVNSLRMLGEMLIKASEVKFSEDYCYKARVRQYDKGE